MTMKKVGTVEFSGITYELTRKDLQLIADALDIVSPDNSEVGEQARKLATQFHVLANAK
ncbi:MAG: hypothetical protein WCC95_18250 [Candidatus Sulfotelmatobacter sp.]